MIFSPTILALLVGSLLVASMLAYASYYGVNILNRWDLRSGSELQLELERRTYLISTIMSYALAFQLVSLFLFVYTADRLAPLFVGAMCAAGSLNVNPWGYATVVVKVANFLLAGIWLIVNHADNGAVDYPLIRPKYLLLIVLAPLVFADLFFQADYFLQLRPDIITSCCGTLFSSEARGFLGSLVAFPRWLVQVLFYGSMAALFAAGGYFVVRAKGAYAVAAASVVAFPVCVLALIAYFSPYIYELPTHHCPFCILQKEYGYVGYPLYLALFLGTVAGLGTGILGSFRRVPSLKKTLPVIQRRLALTALACYAIFGAIVAYQSLSSNLKY